MKVGDRVLLTAEPENDIPEEKGVVIEIEEKEGVFVVQVDKEYQVGEWDDQLRECSFDSLYEIIEKIPGKEFYTKTECEYIVMNPLIQEGMEPAYEWTLADDLVLTFPNIVEYKDGVGVLARDLSEWEYLKNMICYNRRMEILLILGK